MLSHNFASFLEHGSEELKHELFLTFSGGKEKSQDLCAHFIFITPVPPLLFGVSFKVTVLQLAAN